MQNQKSFRESDEFIRGRTGEHIVATELQLKGWYVVPSYDYSGEDNNKAPKLQGAIASYVLPDLDLSKEGMRRWGEVKTKAEPTFTIMTQQFDHGIDRRHYEQYLKIQRITGTPVFLFIYEECSGDILYLSLNSLDEYKRFSSRMGRGGMVFWPRDKFKKLCTVPKKEDAV